MCRRWFSVLLVILVLALSVGASPALAAPTADDNVIHVVQRGETLSGIARRYGVSAWAIAQCNGITNPSRIYAGQRLIIPVSRSCRPTPLPAPGGTLHGPVLLPGAEAWPTARAGGVVGLSRLHADWCLVVPCPAPARVESPPLALWLGPWTGEYFDNATLSGSPYVTRCDATINFAWGYGAPASGMPVDDFSVRWTGTFKFDEGTYRFYAKVDDGVRVYVDDELVIDGWRAGALRTYTTDRALTAGDHSIRVEYYEWIQVAHVCFWMTKLSGPVPAPPPLPMPAPCATPQPPCDC